MKIDQIHLYWPKQTTYVKNLQERSTNEEQEVVVIVEIKKETSACNMSRTNIPQTMQLYLKLPVLWKY